jgi:pilus assembly protein CpaD
MTKEKRMAIMHRGMKFITAALLLLTAGACAPMAENWTPEAAIERRPEVNWTVSRHEIRFAQGSERLAAGEAERLGAFLAGIDLRRPAHVYVGTGAADEDLLLAARRAATARTLLAGHGIRVQSDPPPAEPGLLLAPRPSGADRAVVLAGRFEAHVPGCPDWRKPVLDDFSNYQSSNFGCASAHNLALMVADPQDLVRGRSESAVDGTRAADAVRRYRAGELPALDTGNSGGFVAIPSAGEGS